MVEELIQEVDENFIGRESCDKKHLDNLLCKYEHECWYKLDCKDKVYCNKDWTKENEMKWNYN